MTGDREMGPGSGAVTEACHQACRRGFQRLHPQTSLLPLPTWQSAFAGHAKGLVPAGSPSLTFLLGLPHPSHPGSHQPLKGLPRPQAPLGEGHSVGVTHPCRSWALTPSRHAACTKPQPAGQEGSSGKGVVPPCRSPSRTLLPSSCPPGAHSPVEAAPRPPCTRGWIIGLWSCPGVKSAGIGFPGESREGGAGVKTASPVEGRELDHEGG